MQQEFPVIELTRLDGSHFVLNAERIEQVEARPDTVITLVDGKHLVVQQSVADVMARVIAYRRAIHDCGRERRGETEEVSRG